MVFRGVVLHDFRTILFRNEALNYGISTACKQAIFPEELYFRN